MGRGCHTCLKVFDNSTLWVILMLMSIYFLLPWHCWDFSTSLSSWVFVVQSLSHIRLFATPWTACNTPGSFLLHYLPEFSQIHIHWNSLLHSVYFKYYTVKFCIPLKCCQKCWFVLFWHCIHLFRLYSGCKSYLASWGLWFQSQFSFWSFCSVIQSSHMCAIREKSATWAVFCIKVQLSNLLQCLLESIYTCTAFRVYQDIIHRFKGALSLPLCHLCGCFALLALRDFCEFVAPEGKDFDCYCWVLLCVHVGVLSCFSHVQLFVTLWSVACKAPLPMEFTRQVYWSGLPFLLQGIFLTQGLNEPASLKSPVLVGTFFTTSTTWEALLLSFG